MLLSILLSVAFLTLLERKVLGYLQNRKGPNKLGFKGVLQPFSDAIKLLSKESMVLTMALHAAYLCSPIAILLISLVIWLTHPLGGGGLEVGLPLIFILCCLSVGVYPPLGAGWSSNSKYPMLGGLRAAAQTISYEVSFAILLLSPLTLVSCYKLSSFMSAISWPLLLMSPPLVILWFTSALAETSRTPFDFAEGESELVSGFNTEYSAGGFVLFFLAEYSMILFMSLLFTILFMNVSGLLLPAALLTTMATFLFIWIRGTLPRLRYDKLMSLTWKIFLPLSISYLALALGLPSLTTP